MLDEGIIMRSKSPWMAPAVFVPKKSGQVRICIDNRELNKRTTKDPFLMRCRTNLQDQGFSPLLTCTVDTGSYRSTLMIVQRLPFVLVLAWGCMSSAECHLGYRELPVHFSV